MSKAGRPSGRRKALLSMFILLGSLISLERAVIDVLGQMWGTMLLNSTAMMFGITGLMGICARDDTIIILYAVWSILSIGLNILVILIYNNIGLLVQMEKYLGGNSYWKTHGIGCSQEQQPMNSSNQGEEGSGVLSNSSGMELELESDNCLIAYSIVESVHAAIYAFVAVVSFILCIVFLLCPRRTHQIEDYDEYDDDEEFIYVSVAQPGNSRSHRHSLAK